MQKKDRRNFLKNTALVTMGLGSTMVIAKGKSLQDNPADCSATTLDYFGEGPFYTDNPPTLIDNKIKGIEVDGDPLIISGRIFDLSCNKYIPNAKIDIWHANPNGQYDNQGFNFRGVSTSNEQGFYLFETLKPGKYLNGNQFRPSHIHFKITPPGFDTLTTQLYFEGDEDIPSDAAASIDSGDFDASQRIISLQENTAGQLEGTWDIVIDGNGLPVGINDLHIDKGMIYKLLPTPFRNLLTIKYGVFKKSNVAINVYNLSGERVSELQSSEMTPGKYEAFWEVPETLAKGHYFVSLSINDLQVHYIKALKQ